MKKKIGFSMFWFLHILFLAFLVGLFVSLENNQFTITKEECVNETETGEVQRCEQKEVANLCWSMVGQPKIVGCQDWEYQTITNIEKIKITEDWLNSECKCIEKKGNRYCQDMPENTCGNCICEYGEKITNCPQDCSFTSKCQSWKCENYLVEVKQ